MNHPVFEYATGIICRGDATHDVITEGSLVTVRTPYGDRTARVRVGDADSFVRVGPLRGMPGAYDWLLEWTPAEPVELEGRPLIIFGQAIAA